jgi:pimeloyl-ACP methyl ester carboxylesterase
MIGHSFGSFITNALLATSPGAADAAILTGLGLTMNSQVQIEAFDLRVASLQDRKWSDRDAGYLTWGDIYGNVNKYVIRLSYPAPHNRIEKVINTIFV